MSVSKVMWRSFYNLSVKKFLPHQKPRGAFLRLFFHLYTQIEQLPLESLSSIQSVQMRTIRPPVRYQTASADPSHKDGVSGCWYMKLTNLYVWPEQLCRG
jgi:hypothetical protein